MEIIEWITRQKWSNGQVQSPLCCITASTLRRRAKNGQQSSKEMQQS